MLERLERPVKTESARPGQWLKDDSQWVELARSSENPEQRNRKRKWPPLSLRPVENYATASYRRQYVLFEVRLPDRTVRVDYEGVTATRTPRNPHDHLQQHGCSEPQHKRNGHQRQRDE